MEQEAGLKELLAEFRQMNREFLIPIAAAEHVAVHGEHADPKMIRVGLG